METALKIINYCATLATLIAIFAGFRERGLLWFYVCISFGCDIYEYQTPRSQDPYFIVNFFFLAQYFCVGIYLCMSIFREKDARRKALALYAVFGLYFVIHTLLAHPTESNWEGGAFLYAAMIVLCLMALYNVMLNVEHVRIEHSPLFLVAAFFLLYAAGSCLLLGFDKDIKAQFSTGTINQFWVINSSLGIPKSLAIARALRLQKKSRLSHEL
jgi:surface polysaccharide O-acyltransferase-like enzyme